MNRYLTFVLVAVIALTVGACCKRGSVSSGPTPGSNEPAATVNGTAITMAELDEAAKGQLQKMDTQIYRIKKGVLDGLIETKLIEQAAKEKGVDVDAYLKTEIDDKVEEPTDNEVKALYDARKDQIGQPFDEAKKQIAEYLKQNRVNRVRQDLIASLREKGAVSVKLEPPRMVIDIKGMPHMGDDGAKITLVEFSDYQCPYCKRVRPTIWQLKDKYGDKINYVFGDFPLSFHKQSKKAHEAAHCAGDQDKYFDYNKMIFDNQNKIGVDDLKDYARKLKLKGDAFDKCLDSGKYSDLVDELTNRGANAGVSGTPAYFINGIQLSGAQPYQAFEEVIEEELKK